MRNWLRWLFGAHTPQDNHQQSDTCSDAPTPDMEMNALLRELAGAVVDREPNHIEALCRQILALDEERHAHSSDPHAAVLGTVDNALSIQADRKPGTAGLHLLEEMVTTCHAALTGLDPTVACFIRVPVLH